jgi:hypothetical protein
MLQPQEEFICEVEDTVEPRLPETRSAAVCAEEDDAQDETWSI